MATWANFGLARTKLAANAVDEAAALITPACDATDRLIARDGTVVEWRLDLRSSCLELQARLALARNNASEAGRYADDLLAAAKAESARTHSQDAAIAEANAWLMKGLALRAAGNGPMSTSAFKQASASWPAGVADRASYMARRVVIFKATGRTAEANALAQRLAAVGFADPLYLRDARSVG
jgi:hypothetical protein